MFSSSVHFNTGEMKQMQQPCLHAASGEHIPEIMARMMLLGMLMSGCQLPTVHNKQGNNLVTGQVNMNCIVFKCSTPKRRKKKETIIHMQPPKQQK